MSGFIVIIFFVFIVLRIMAAGSASQKKEKQEKTQELITRLSQSTVSGGNPMSDERFDQTPIGMAEPARPAKPVVNAAQSRPQAAAAKGANQMKNTAVNAGQAKKNTSAAPAEETQEKKKSTTELLQEKAMQDQRQHLQEKREHEMEERRIHGKLNYAKRHYPGDAIPNGMREVICGYCNAENLVPAHDFATKYNCYFCRELL